MTINIELPGPAAHRVIWRDGTDEPSNWTQYHDDSDPLPESWDDEVPDIVTPLYTADQVRAIVAADRAERAAPAAYDPAVPTNIRLTEIVWQTRDRDVLGEGTEPQEYVLEGWREAEKYHGIAGIPSGGVEGSV